MMKRVYTDECLPGVTIVNQGGPLFEVLSDGVLVTTFKGYESRFSEKVSEAFAKRCARAYMDRLIESSSSETGTEEKFDAPHRKPSTEEVDQLIAQARAEKDPAKAKELKRRALHLMANESVAEQVVATLLED
jgi:hypothetical protein